MLQALHQPKVRDAKSISSIKPLRSFPFFSFFPFPFFLPLLRLTCSTEPSSGLGMGLILSNFQSLLSFLFGDVVLLADIFLASSSVALLVVEVGESLKNAVTSHDLGASYEVRPQTA